MMLGAPHKMGNSLKQLLLHRSGRDTNCCFSSPREAAASSPGSPGPCTRQKQKGCRQGAASFPFVYPKHRKGLTEEIPALATHMSGYSPRSKQRQQRRSNTYICAAAASPGSPPT